MARKHAKMPHPSPASPGCPCADRCPCRTAPPPTRADVLPHPDGCAKSEDLPSAAQRGTHAAPGMHVLPSSMLCRPLLWPDRRNRIGRFFLLGSPSLLPTQGRRQVHEGFPRSIGFAAKIHESCSIFHNSRSARQKTPDCLSLISAGFSQNESQASPGSFPASVFFA